jgi:hypothetical protein
MAVISVEACLLPQVEQAGQVPGHNGGNPALKSQPEIEKISHWKTVEFDPGQKNNCSLLNCHVTEKSLHVQGDAGHSS